MTVYINRKNGKLFKVENDPEYNDIQLDDLIYQGVKMVGAEFFDEKDTKDISRKLLKNYFKFILGNRCTND